MTSDALDDKGGLEEELENVGPAPQVFLSYRRADGDGVASTVADRLRIDLGSENVFRDTDDLIAGQVWKEVLVESIDSSDAVIVMLGPDWAGVGDDGTRRIDSGDDPVRSEIAQALKPDTLPDVIPVLVDVDSLPVLPPELKPLSEHHFVKANSESLGDPSDAAYQQVLVGVWETLNHHHPNGVLIIGDGVANAQLERLVKQLQDSNAIEAAELSRFAGGAVIVSAKSARKGAKKWPDVIVVAPADSMNEVLRARIHALEQNKRISEIAVVGAGAAAAGVFLGSLASSGAGAASSATVVTYATGAELAGSVPSAGTGLIAAIGSATVGVKAAAVAGVLAVTVVSGAAVVAALDNGSDVAIGYPDRSTLPLAVYDEGPFYPLGEPDAVTVFLSSPVSTDDTGVFSVEDATAFVTREVLLGLVDGDGQVPMGVVTLPKTLESDFVGLQSDGRYLVGEVTQEVPLREHAFAVDNPCVNPEDPSVAIGGFPVTGEGAEAIVQFWMVIADGDVTETGMSVTVDALTTLELLPGAELESIGECTDGYRDVTWTN
jgi:hypothetical protein